jgi:hypothetical protein
MVDSSEDKMLKWFAYAQLTPELQKTAKTFRLLAKEITHTIRPGPERTEALRKLLESRDAAIRARIFPGG